MAKDLNVYDMSDKGVNTTKSPVHLEDGELVKAQNWQTDATLADGAIRRRDAMTKLNSTALAGSVKGLIAMPFPAAFTVTRVFYAPIDESLAAQTTASWRTSTDGATWTTITTATLQEAAQTYHSNGTDGIFSTNIRGVTPWVGFNHRIYFPGDDYNSSEDGGTITNPALYSWDGTTAVKLFEVPGSPANGTSKCQAIVSVVPYGEAELLISCHDNDLTGGLVYTRVLLYSTVTGSLEQLGPATSLVGSALALTVYQGRIWIAPTNFDTITIDVSWIRPGDSAWTVDAALPAANIGGVSFAEFLGDLYLGTHGSATSSTNATIRKRTAATAAWSTVKSTDGSTGGSTYLGPMIVTAAGTTILAYYNSVDGAGVLQRILSSTDGTTWITDLDVVADLGAGFIVSGVPFLDSDGSIYWPLRKSDNTGFIKKRTSGGTWSTVDTINNLRGPIVALKTV